MMDIDYAVITIVAANVGLAWGVISSTRNSIQENRKEMISLFLHSDKKIDEMAKEMKDFHGKLCEIEGMKKIGDAK
jgi:hypothetical protein